MNAANPVYDLFLSYSRRDNEFVSALNKDLESCGIRTFLDRNQLKPGLPWPEALEEALLASRAVAVFVGPEGLGPWQSREKDLALDLQTKKAPQQFPVIPVLLPGGHEKLSFLFRNTYIDFRKQTDLRILIDAVRNGPSGINPPRVDVCPYQSLNVFREEDRPFYFGRHELIEGSLPKVQPNAFVAVVGPSGSGKSSFAFAGLTPRLRARQLPEATWEVVSFTPGKDPWYNLAAGLMPLLEPDATDARRLLEAGDLAEALAARKGALPSAIARALEKTKGTKYLLLLVDQFEELFTQAPECDRAPFIANLIETCREPSPMAVLITLRADYYGLALRVSQQLADALLSRQINLGPLSQEGLEDVIRRPAGLVGLPIEEGLAGQMVSDALGQPGNLPLLEYALTEVWKRGGGAMTHAAYEAAGRVAGSIATRAESIYNDLSPEEQATAQRLFPRLVRVSAAEDEGTDTRNRVGKAEISDEAWKIAQKFAHHDARLLVISGGEQPGTETVEVAHEALIRSWVRLRGWIREDRAFLVWRQRLVFRIAEWRRTKEAESELLQGPALEEALDWLKKREPDLSNEERRYIDRPSTTEYQIAKIRTDAPSLVSFADAETKTAWCTALYGIAPGEALEAAHRLDVLAPVLDGLVRKFAAAGNSDAAVAMLHQIEPESRRLDPLLALLGAAPDQSASELAREALALAAADRNIYGGYPRIPELLIALTKSGRARLAIELLRERMPSEADALLNTTVASLAASPLDLAQGFIRAAGEQNSGLLYTTLSNKRADMGRIDEAVEIAARITPADVRDRQFMNIAERPSVGPDAARGIAERIEGASFRASALAAVAVNLARAGHETQALELARKAVDLASLLPNSYDRRQVLKRLVEGFARASDRPDLPGQEDSYIPRRITSWIPDPEDRLAALAAAFDAALRDPEGVEKFNVLNDAQSAAASLEPAWRRDRAMAEFLNSSPAVSPSLLRIKPGTRLEPMDPVLAQLADIRINAGRVLGALDAALAIGDRSERKQALVSLLRKVAAGSRPMRATELADLIPEGGLREEVIKVALEPAPDPAPLPAPDFPNAAEIAQHLAGGRAEQAAPLIDGAVKSISALNSYLQTGPYVALIQTVALAGPHEMAVTLTAQRAPNDRGNIAATVTRQLVLSGAVYAAEEYARRALELIRPLESYYRRDALTRIAQTLALKDLGAAMRLVRAIADPLDRANAMAAVIREALAGGGQADAIALATEAFTITESSQPYDRKTVRKSILQSFCYLGLSEQVLHLIERASSEDDLPDLLASSGLDLWRAGYRDEGVAAIQRIAPDWQRRRALTEILTTAFNEYGDGEIRSFIRSFTGGDRDDLLANAAKLIANAADMEAAIGMAVGISNPFNRGSALAEVLLIGDGGSRTIIGNAHMIRAPDQRAAAVLQVSAKLAQAGLTRISADVAAAFDMPEAQASAAAQIAPILMASGRTDEAVAMIEAGIAATMKLEPWKRDNPIKSLMAILPSDSPDLFSRLVAGIGDAALRAEILIPKLPEKALEAAGAVSDPQKRVKILEALSKHFADAGDPDRAVVIAESVPEPSVQADLLMHVAARLGPEDDGRKRLADRAASLLNRVTVFATRSTLSATLAGLRASSGQFEEARLLVDQSAPQDKLRAYAAIVGAYHSAAQFPPETAHPA